MDAVLPGWTIIMFVVIGVVGILINIYLITHGLQHPALWKEHTRVLSWRPCNWHDFFWLILLTIGMCILLKTAGLHLGGLIFLFWYLKRNALSWKSAFGTPKGSIFRDMAWGTGFYLAAFRQPFWHFIYFKICYWLWALIPNRK